MIQLLKTEWKWSWFDIVIDIIIRTQKIDLIQLNTKTILQRLINKKQKTSEKFDYYLIYYDYPFLAYQIYGNEYDNKEVKKECGGMIWDIVHSHIFDMRE